MIGSRCAFASDKRTRKSGTSAEPGIAFGRRLANWRTLERRREKCFRGKIELLTFLRPLRTGAPGWEPLAECVSDSNSQRQLAALSSPDISHFPKGIAPAHQPQFQA